MFLSPALFHAAGTNSKSSDRIANLLQASSAFGKTMESVDRVKMTKLIYAVLLDSKKYHQFIPDETTSYTLLITSLDSGLSAGKILNCLYRNEGQTC